MSPSLRGEDTQLKSSFMKASCQEDYFSTLIRLRFPSSRRFLDPRTGAVNDVASAHSVLDDTSEQPPDCFRICRLGEEQPQSGFGVHDDSADRLVDFGNRRR